ncbi:MAG TPA: hypothetical protein VKA21_15305 [Candidatus Binatia bacterium]|nr:hypothetical protein [Candidatus Binatia bacterium]
MRLIGFRAAAAVGATVLALGVGLAPASDEPPTYGVSSGKALVKPGTIAKFSRKAPRSAPLDLPNVPDNDPTIEGGSLTFYEIDNPSNRMTFALPSTGWEKMGRDPAAPIGFRFRSPGPPTNACTSVMVKRGVVKATCRGADLVLMTPLVSNFLGVTLTIGTDSKKYCPGYYARTNEFGLVRGVPAIVSQSQLCSPSGAFLD